MSFRSIVIFSEIKSLDHSFVLEWFIFEGSMVIVKSIKDLNDTLEEVLELKSKCISNLKRQSRTCFPSKVYKKD